MIEPLPFGLKLVTAPASEPVSLTEAKARLKVTTTDFDADITAMIGAARAAAENETGVALVTQTWSLYLDAFPARRVITIPRPPLASVTWIKYYDADGVQQTLSSSTYYVAVGVDPGRVVLKQSQTWPTIEQGRPEAIEVRFVAGVAAASVPKEVSDAILLIVAHRFENPGGDDKAIPAAARRLLNGSEFGGYR